ncbi:MAG: glucose-6-phosphate isomerase, partial [Hyphomicrobiaceae bacterium]
MSTLYRQEVGGGLDDAIGRHGLPRASLERWLAKLDPALADLRNDYRSGRLALLRCAEETADVAAAADALHRLSQGARTLVFFGTGGSSLGGQTLAQTAGWNIPGSAGEDRHFQPRTRFYDNLDPDTLHRVLDHLDLATTRFVVISKSGNTPETLVQTIAALTAVKTRGLEARVPNLFLGVTEPAADGKKNGLRALLASHGIAMLDHHTGIGGRYSVLTNVGFLPALARGLDAAAIRTGARSVVADLLAARA